MHRSGHKSELQYEMSPTQTKEDLESDLYGSNYNIVNTFAPRSVGNSADF